MDPGTKAMWGNFPQALTHLALVNAAVLLDASVADARAATNGRPVGSPEPQAAIGQPSDERTTRDE